MDNPCRHVWNGFKSLATLRILGMLTCCWAAYNVLSFSYSGAVRVSPRGCSWGSRIASSSEQQFLFQVVVVLKGMKLHFPCMGGTVVAGTRPKMIPRLNVSIWQRFSATWSLETVPETKLRPHRSAMAQS